MSRTGCVVFVTLGFASLIALPMNASAKDLWAVLEELSGPGPFRGISAGLTLCFGGTDGTELVTDPKLTRSATNTPIRRWCLHFDRGKFGADASDDRVLPKIDIT